MQQWDMVLLAKLVRAPNRNAVYRKMRNLGIGEHLINPILRPVWSWIRQLDLEDRGLPTETMLRAKFPGVSFPRTTDFNEAVEHDSVEEAALRLRERNLAVIAQEAGTRLMQMAEDNIGEIPRFLDKVQKDVLGTVPIPSVIEAGATVEEDMLEYAQFGKPGGAGLRFPYPSVVPGGMGLNPAASYWIYGPPGMKKTWFLVFLTLWYLKNFPSSRILFLSQEMVWERIKWRFYTLWGGFSWNDVQDSKVPPDEMRDVINQFRLGRRLHVRGPIAAPDARPVIEALISAFEPDYVFDDSSYLRTMQTGRDISMIRNSAHLTSEWSGFVKNLSAKYGIPYFMTWQPNDDGALYGGRSGVQDAEGIFYIEGPKDGTTSTLGVKKNRDGMPVSEINIRTDLDNTASFGEETDSLERIGRSSIKGGFKPRVVLSPLDPSEELPEG